MLMAGVIFVGSKEVSFNPKENLDVSNHADYQLLSKTNEDLILTKKEEIIMSIKALDSGVPTIGRRGSLAGIVGMGYALFSYTVGAGVLFWLFFASVGFVPYGLTSQTESVINALLINIGLVVLFASQHTVMARRSFKKWVTQWIPQHLERATFVLLSGLAMLMLIICWQSLPGVVWEINHGIGRLVLIIGSLMGMAYILATSFITGHFELFGVRQAYLNLIGKKYSPLEFKRKWFYTYSRHPMMLGILFVLWCTPDMTVTRFALAALLTMYLFMGIQFEEKGLVAEFGEHYRQYKREIGIFFTIKREE
jgi:protein-S-isoprenylcysteine O-methyltransferase Ste14